ncbi:MAG: tetratricopeptide repeat protein [Acidobacteriota bacterium]
MRRMPGNAVWTLILAALAAACLFSNAGAQKTPNFTAAQWQADVRFLGEQLPMVHKNAFHRVGREEFDAAVDSLYSGVPNMSADEIVVGMMKIIAMVHDGHTYMEAAPYFRSGAFPVSFYRFSDGLYVQKAAPAYSDIVGGKVVRIGNASADDALAAVSAVVSADNKMGIMDGGPKLLAIPEILAGLKLISDKQKLTVVVNKDGKEHSAELKPQGTFHDIFDTPPDWVDAAKMQNAQLYLMHMGDPYWFEYLKVKQIVYVKQNAVQNKPDETLANFYKRVFELIENNPVDKLVIDLRNNGGGNNGLNTSIIIQLIRSKVDKPGHLFVITGRQTFSAAQNFTNLLEKFTDAIFVGEPTADHVNMYGDNRPFTLPNSGLVVRASTLWWQDLDPRDERKWKAPDIAAELSFDDYRSGRDPALQAVIDHKPGQSVAELVRSASKSATLGNFVQQTRAAKADQRNRYVEFEAMLNRLGYDLLAKKRVADAVEIFQLNAETNPGSANVYDSLGDALVIAGKTDEAIRSYEKAVAIDPNYASSIEALKRLKKK